jgi:hypothetical protein
VEALAHVARCIIASIDTPFCKAFEVEADRKECAEQSISAISSTCFKCFAKVLGRGRLNGLDKIKHNELLFNLRSAVFFR